MNKALNTCKYPDHQLYLQIFPKVSFGNKWERGHHNYGSVTVGQAHLASDIVTSKLYTPVVFVSQTRIHLARICDRICHMMVNHGFWRLLLGWHCFSKPSQYKSILTPNSKGFLALTKPHKTGDQNVGFGGKRPQNQLRTLGFSGGWFRSTYICLSEDFCTLRVGYFWLSNSTFDNLCCIFIEKSN